MPPILRLLRPKQWTKGFLVFAALLFGRGYTSGTKSELALIAFAAMALVSSAVYVFNDLCDAERDRLHPTKKLRPIASGQVSRTTAAVLLVFCAALGVGLAAGLGTASFGIIATYILIQIAYNVGLKRQPVADVFCLSFGFVLRAALGAAAINVLISGWLLFCTGALALMLGFGKRRHEWLVQGDDRARSRESLAGYNKQTLEAFLLIAAASAVMSYGIYSVESPTARQFPSLILTSGFVFYGIYRYVFLLLGRDEGGEPENLVFRDPHLIFSVVGFVVTALVALSGLRIPFLESAGALR